MDYYLGCWQKFATFQGRARRREYWFFILFNAIISIALAITDISLGGDSMGLLSGLYSLLIFLPSLAVTVRRLHDIDRSGWWLLLYVVPVVGVLVILVFTVLDGTQGNNEFGPDPKAPGL